MKDSTITFCCAPAGVGSGANLGMRTVDLAAYNTIVRTGVDAKIKHPWEAVSQRLGARQETVDLDRWPSFTLEYTDNDTNHGAYPLFWGDFQHGHDYQVQSSKRFQEVQRKLGKTVSSAEAIDWCYNYFLQENSSKDSRFGSFGTTLFQNNGRDWADSRYYSAIEAFLKRADICRFRDPYSAWCVKQLRNDFETNYHGVDAAMLNTRQELLDIENTGVTEKIGDESRLGLFIGRSTKEISWLGLSKLVSRLANGTGTTPTWIPWSYHASGLLAGRPKISRLLMPRLEDYSSERLMSGDILTLLGKCRLVITDTYHLAINSLCMGIPAICIYQAAPDRMRDANMGWRYAPRDKRALLYSSVNLSDFLMPSNDLRSKKQMNAKIDHITQYLNDDEAMLGWRRWFENEQRYYRQWIDQKVTDIASNSTGTA